MAAGTRLATSVLETIRQYAAERLAEAGELAEVHARHVRWCLNAGAALGADTRTDSATWRSAFDRIADELRYALGWAAARPACRPDGYQLAVCLAELSYVRGMPGESQRRYEQAAGLSQTEAAAAQALHLAAGAASARHFGDDALRLHRAAADAALRAGDKVSAARDLAQAAEFINRAFGLIADMPPAGAVDALLTEARALAGGDLAAEARIRTAEAFAGPEIDPATAEATEQALVLARRAGRPAGRQRPRWTSSLPSSWRAGKSARRQPARGGAQACWQRCPSGPIQALRCPTPTAWRPTPPPPPATCRPRGALPSGSGTCRSTARRGTWQLPGCSSSRPWPATGPKQSR